MFVIVIASASKIHYLFFTFQVEYFTLQLSDSVIYNYEIIFIFKKEEKKIVSNSIYFSYEYLIKNIISIFN